MPYLEVRGAEKSFTTAAGTTRVLGGVDLSLDAERWRQALDGVLRSLVAAGRTTEARARLRERLGV